MRIKVEGSSELVRLYEALENAHDKENAMRHIFLILFIISFISLIVVLAIEIPLALEIGRWKLIPLGDLIEKVGLLGSLNLLQAVVERYVSSDFWWDYLEPTLHFSALFVTFTLTSVFFSIYRFFQSSYRGRKVELLSSDY